MYNYFMLVGDLKEMNVYSENGCIKKAVLKMSVRRDFKDMDGEYIYDDIDVTIYDFLAEMANDSLRKDSRFGIKGRIKPNKKVLELVGERIIYFDNMRGEE